MACPKYSRHFNDLTSFPPPSSHFFGRGASRVDTLDKVSASSVCLSVENLSVWSVIMQHAEPAPEMEPQPVCTLCRLLASLSSYSNRPRVNRGLKMKPAAIGSLSRQRNAQSNKRVECEKIYGN